MNRKNHPVVSIGEPIKFLLIQAVVSITFIFGCSSGQTVVESSCPDMGTNPVLYTIVSEGAFCDNDTYIIRAAGVQDNKGADVESKKNRAKRLAVLEAQYKLLEVFLGNRIETWGPMYEPSREYLEGQALWKNDVVALVKNGTVLSESYDDELNCTILYMIRRKNLRTFKDIPFEEYKGNEE